MTRSGLVLAAHGSRHDPMVNAQIRELAAKVAARTAFNQVGCAFHQGSPSFAGILDELEAEDVTVVPVMTSSGYYSETVLRRELARNRCFPRVCVRQTIPVGLHPDVPALVAKRVGRLSALLGKDSRRAAPIPLTVALVGHGTPRHPSSRDATLFLARALRDMHCSDEVITLFLDDQPPVERLWERASSPNIIVVPFLMGAGPHAVLDLPRRMGMRRQKPGDQPWTATVSGRHVACDVPFGALSGVVDLIVDLATATPRGTSAHPGQILEVA